MFWNKKPVEDNRELLRQIGSLMSMLEKRITTLELEVDDIRMRLRKKSFFGKKIEEDTETKDIYKGVLLPE
jgi:hypothetical protein